MAALLFESIVPHSCRADQVRIVSERGECDLCLFGRDEAAAAGDHFADAVEKKRSALHHAAAQHNCVGCKQVDQVGEADPEIVALMFDGLLCDGVTLLREFADLLRGNASAMRSEERR